jgi:hypothetical protein
VSSTTCRNPPETVKLFCSRPWSMRSLPVPTSAISGAAAQDAERAVVRRRDHPPGNIAAAEGDPFRGCRMIDHWPISGRQPPHHLPRARPVHGETHHIVVGDRTSHQRLWHDNVWTRPTVPCLIRVLDSSARAA